MGIMSQKVIEDEALSMDTPTDFTLSGGLPEEKSTWEDVVSRGKGRVDDAVQYGTNLVEKGADMALSAGKDIAEDVIEYGADALGFGPEKQISITQEAVLLTNEMVDAGLIPQRYRMQMLLPEVGVTVTRENISIDGGDDSVFNAVNHALFSYEAGQSKVTAVASQAKEVYQGVSKKLSGLDPKTEYLDYFNNKFGFNLAEQGLSREEAKNAIMDSIGNIDQKGASGKLSRGEPLVGGEVLAINQDNIEYGFAAGGLVANEELNVDTLSGYSLSGGLPKAVTPVEGDDTAALNAAITAMRKEEAKGSEPTFYDMDDQDFPEEYAAPTPTTAITQTEEALVASTVAREGDRGLSIGSVNTVDEAVTNAVYTTVQMAENGVRSGWSKDTRKWLPHDSAEGGTPTIAYGHKFATQAEADAVTASGGITEAKAIEWFNEDMGTAKDRAKSQYEAEYTNKEWKDLDVLGKLMLTEVVFNIGTLKDDAGEYGWPSLTTAIHDKDFSVAKDQLSRTYTKPDGTVESLVNRTTALQGIYEKVIPLTDWTIEPKPVDLTDWDNMIN